MTQYILISEYGDITVKMNPTKEEMETLCWPSVLRLDDIGCGLSEVSKQLHNGDWELIETDWSK